MKDFLEWYSVLWFGSTGSRQMGMIIWSRDHTFGNANLHIHNIVLCFNWSDMLKTLPSLPILPPGRPASWRIQASKIMATKKSNEKSDTYARVHPHTLCNKTEHCLPCMIKPQMIDAHAGPSNNREGQASFARWVSWSKMRSKWTTIITVPWSQAYPWPSSSLYPGAYIDPYWVSLTATESLWAESWLNWLCRPCSSWLRLHHMALLVSFNLPSSLAPSGRIGPTFSGPISRLNPVPACHLQVRNVQSQADTHSATISREQGDHRCLQSLTYTNGCSFSLTNTPHSKGFP